MLASSAAVFLVLFCVQATFSTTCYFCNNSGAYSKGCTNLGECEGEFCYLYNYTTSTEGKHFIDRGCITGVKNITVGCYRANLNFAQECYCNTDHCNDGFIVYDTISKPKVWKCKHWDSVDNVTTEQDGYRCMITFVVNATASGGPSYGLRLQRPVSKLHHRFDFAVFSHVEKPGDRICITEPAGAGARSEFGDLWVECECAGDRCNRDLSTFPYPPVSKKVQCRSRHEIRYNATTARYDYDEFESVCTGDYCYESHRYPQANDTIPAQIPEVHKSYGCWSATHKPISTDVSYINEEGMRYHLRLCESDFCTGETDL